MVGEIRVIGDPRINLSDFSWWQHLSIFADEPKLRARRNLADGAGLCQGVFRIGERDRAGFSAAVELIDHWPPPIDHSPLDVGWTWGCRVYHVAQRGHVVLAAYLLWKLHQPDEHRRHHEHGVDLLGLDETQELLRIKSRHQHQRAAKTPGPQTERVRRRMIKRSRQQSSPS